ncbi:cytochrome c oxidase subunit 3 [Candidatus Neptunochlamydia vexilliferae]|uniref:Cytochrome bo(3) ubiquinol oxidase subunit 3 n=1 Tax=Candidatus Neptunichlamydia vexilliferae TaxID=1651774 RepID=A0ABS0AXG5_9BACT|nr:cytochrome c oxidase subunit 3 [Candidatus Neptunochlamydia vexilliferae]MBF5058829.1 Cytochrome bo(3) ubiquinol oxidase subunit 3 [Candidatus Neptunochlamydia vexilliferae]
MSQYPDTHHDVYSKTTFGFWLYIVTDFMLFATLFAAYAVLRNNTFGGPTARELFDLDFTLIQTFVLLTATLTVGLGGAFAHRRNKWGAISFFTLTFLLGLIFLGMQESDFSRLIQSGNGWERNAFLSAYFSVVGIFWLHIIFALLWTILLLIPLFCQGVSPASIRRLTCLRMFWQFLNMVWVFIFAIVYLIGVS